MDEFKQIQKITVSDEASVDYFGYSVSIYEDTIVVGAYGDDDKGSDSGSAYIFEKNSNEDWEEIQKITASDGAIYNRFGYSISIYNETIVVGTYDDRNSESGSAYIFEKNSNGAWSQIQKITASDGELNDYFGSSVSIYEDIIVVGASEDDDKGTYSGSAYIFELGEKEPYCKLE